MGQAQGGNPQQKVVYPYPSRFGSHSSMISEEQTAMLNDPWKKGQSEVVLQDEFGFYTTFRDRLDTGMADPKRYEISRLKNLLQRSADEEKEKKSNKEN